MATSWSALAGLLVAFDMAVDVIAAGDVALSVPAGTEEDPEVTADGEVTFELDAELAGAGVLDLVLVADADDGATVVVALVDSVAGGAVVFVAPTVIKPSA